MGSTGLIYSLLLKRFAGKCLAQLRGHAIDYSGLDTTSIVIRGLFGVLNGKIR